MTQENKKQRGSNITQSQKRKVVNNFRGSNKIKHFIQMIKSYKIIGTGNDKLSVSDINCAKYFAEPFDKNSGRD